MAPKDLLRHVFHNIYRQKSLEGMRVRRAEEALLISQSPATQRTRTDTAPSLSLSPMSSPRIGQTTIRSLNEEEPHVEEMSDLDTTLEVNEETIFKDSYAEGYGPGVNHQVYHEALSMTTSHLDTIGTALILLQAIAGLSQHTEGLKNEMLAKKASCEQTLETLKLMDVEEHNVEV